MHLDLLRTVDLAPSVRAALHRQEQRGEVLRLRRGAYVDADVWRASSERDRHLARIRAVTGQLGDDLVLSRSSAVAVHGLPWIGDHGASVTVTDPKRDRGQTKKSVRRVGSAGREPRTVVIDGLRVTDLAETAVDVAVGEHPWRAAVVLDAVLRSGITREEVFDVLDQRGPVRNRRVARDLVEHADGASESPGESITRWAAHVLGAPRPVLQHEFRWAGGLRDRVDLWFSEQGVVIEFDGAVKYRDRELRQGRDATEVVVIEKRREDRIRRRSEVSGFGRVGWADAMPGGQLPRILHEAGVPLGSSWMTAWRHAARRAL